MYFTQYEKIANMQLINLIIAWQKSQIHKQSSTDFQIGKSWSFFRNWKRFQCRIGTYSGVEMTVNFLTDILPSHHFPCLLFVLFLRKMWSSRTRDLHFHISKYCFERVEFKVLKQFFVLPKMANTIIPYTWKIEEWYG